MPVLPLRQRGAGLDGPWGQFRPGGQVSGGGEPGHVQPDLGHDDLRAAVLAEAGDLGQPLQQPTGAAAGPRTPARPVRRVPRRCGRRVGVPQAWVGQGGDQLIDPGGELVDLAGEGVDRSPAASGPAHRGGRRTGRSAPRPARCAWRFIRPRASPASARGSRSPAISASTMSRTESVSSREATRDTLIRASSSSFSSRCQCRVRSRVRSTRSRV